MRPALPASLLTLVLVTACSGAPDLDTAEGELKRVEGVSDADAAWFDGSWKIADASAVSVAVGSALDEDDVERLADDLTDAVAGLGWEVEPNLAVELDDDADAVPFLSSFPGDDNTPPPTDISTYTLHAANLDERDVAADLQFLLQAQEALGAPVQVTFSDEDVLDATAEVPTPAAELASGLQPLVDGAQPTGTTRWRLTGPDLLLESEAGLAQVDLALWERVVSGSESLGGLERTRVALSVGDDRRLTVVRLTLRSSGPASAATRAVTPPARRLSALLERLGVDQVDVVVEAADRSLVRAFYEGAERAWEPADGAV